MGLYIRKKISSLRLLHFITCTIISQIYNKLKQTSAFRKQTFPVQIQNPQCNRMTQITLALNL